MGGSSRMGVSDKPDGGWLVLYGSLMRGLGAMDSLNLGGRIRFVGPCLCPGELFDLGEYPGLRPGDARVIGELYALIDPDALQILDPFEGFDPAHPRESLYIRDSVKLIAPADTRAWVYVYNHVPDASQRILSGDWRAHMSSREDLATL